MRTSAPLALAALALVSLTGCYSAHEGGGVAPRDGGVAIDSGPIARDGGPGHDAGLPADCRTEVVERYPGTGACSPAVSDCIARCPGGGADDCPGMCIGSEPECQRCFFQDLISCANELGCSDAWHTFACCTESIPICSGAAGVDRIQCAGSCMGEIDAYSMCLSGSASMRCYFEAATGCGVRLGGG